MKGDDNMDTIQLIDVTNNIIKILKEGGLKECSIYKINRIYTILIEKIDDDYTYEKGIRCLQMHYNTEYISRAKLRALKHIDSYINKKNILNIQYSYKSVLIEADLFKEIKTDYTDYLIKRNLNSSNIKANLRYTNEFLKTVNVEQLSDITQIDIHNYINIINEKYALSGRKTLIYRLKNFIRYLKDNCYVPYTAKQVIPRICSKNKCEIISYYTKKEIKEILDNIENTTLKGKRDLAIVLLALTYGLRSSDIANLKEDNIDWNNNEIKIIQIKTLKELVLPLTFNVKIALLDYYKMNYEKIREEKYFFLRTVHPFTRFSERIPHSILATIIKNTSIIVATRKRGLHALRHSFAKNSLENNVPITTIKEVLGHSSIVSTTSYLSIHTSELKNLSLEVPKYD